MNLRQIEFYNTPEGDIMVKHVGEKATLLATGDRDVILSMLDYLYTYYTEAYKALVDLYSMRKRNRIYFEFSIVSRFIRCNFGEYDQSQCDIDRNGHFSFEEVKCPLRGTGDCPLENVVCRPKFIISLSLRELEVYRLIVQNKKAEDIAYQLSISKHTVDRHRENIKARLGLNNIPELITFWYSNNLH
jgi:DNA-binding CsgD family transcriptional regulator